MREQNYREAVRLFSRAVATYPDDLMLMANLGEAQFRLGDLGAAEKVYRSLLAISSESVEAHFGLGEVFIALGEAGDHDSYEEAIAYLTRGIELIDLQIGSKRVSKGELASALYLRGYAQVKLYEASKLKKDLGWIQQAIQDFSRCYCRCDPDYHQARRAKEKLEKKFFSVSPGSILETFGPWTVFLAACSVFFASLSSYVSAHEAKSAIYYATYCLASLLFMIASVYLPQLLKLKVAGVELEKKAIDQVAATEPIGITRFSREPVPLTKSLVEASRWGDE